MKLPLPLLLLTGALPLGWSALAQDAPSPALSASPNWLVGVQAAYYPAVAWTTDGINHNGFARPWPAQLVVRRRLGGAALETGLALYASSPAPYQSTNNGDTYTFRATTQTYLVPLVGRFRLLPRRPTNWRLDAAVGFLLILNKFYCPATVYSSKTGQSSNFISGDYAQSFLPLHAGLGATYQLGRHLCLTADARLLWEGGTPFNASPLLPTASLGIGYALGQQAPRPTGEWRYIVP